MNAIVFLPNDAGASDGFFGVYLFAKATGITLVEQTAPAAAAGDFIESSLGTIPLGIAKRYDIRVHFGGDEKVVTVAIDGMKVYEEATFPYFQRGLLSVSAGVHYTEAPTGPTTVTIDDVFAEVK
jgi:hypothetical protein